MATQLVSTPVMPDYTDDSRWERIDGQCIERPVPTTKHALLQKRVLNLLDEAIKAFDPRPVILPEWSIDQPEFAQRDERPSQ